MDQEAALQEAMYQPADVADRLGSMAWLAAAYAALCAVTGVMTSGSRSSKRPALTAENRLRLIRARREENAAVTKQEISKRRRYCMASGAVILLCTGLSLRYLLNGSNFISWELEEVVGQMALHTAPWLLIALSAAYAGMCLCDASREREIAALRELPAKPLRLQNQKTDRSVQPVRIVLYAIAVLFVVLGVMNGGLRDVLVKAINICTECIGLG
jgi:hypothetical protein